MKKMKKIKTSAAVLLLSAVLLTGQPGIAQSIRSVALQMPPAVVFIQDKNKKMLIKHSFEEDNALLIPWDLSTIDNGFYVDIPEGK